MSIDDDFSGMGDGALPGPDSMPTEMMDPMSAVNNDLGDPIGTAEAWGGDAVAALNDPVGTFDSGVSNIGDMGGAALNQAGDLANVMAEENSPIVTAYKMAEGVDGSLYLNQQDLAAAEGDVMSGANAMIAAGGQLAGEFGDMGQGLAPAPPVLTPQEAEAELIRAEDRQLDY